MRLAAGDALYRQNRRAEASSVYADVLCAIENYWQATGQSYFATDARTAVRRRGQRGPDHRARRHSGRSVRAASQLTLLVNRHEDGSAVAEGLRHVRPGCRRIRSPSSRRSRA